MAQNWAKWRDKQYDNSASSLHTPLSLLEYALRRDAFGEGMLAVTAEGLMSSAADQKYLSFFLALEKWSSDISVRIIPSVLDKKTLSKTNLMEFQGQGLKIMSKYGHLQEQWLKTRKGTQKVQV